MKIDNKLLYLKSENYRISLKEIAHLLHKSPSLLKYSINVLEKESVLKHPYCIFDYSYFGLIVFKVYFRGAYVSEKDKDIIIRKLIQNPYVIATFELIGEFDLAVEFACPNPSRFNKELKSISAEHKTLSEYKTIVNLVTYLNPKKYLIHNPGLQSRFSHIVIGGDRDVQSFSANEMGVMAALLKKPGIRYTNLARETSLNTRTVKKIWKDLEKREIIHGFKCLTDTARTGVYKYRVFLKLHNIDPKREKTLLYALLRMDIVVMISKTVGDWNIEVDIESFDRTKIRKVMMKIRQEYKDLIEGSNPIEIYDHTLRQYLPKYLFI